VRGRHVSGAAAWPNQRGSGSAVRGGPTGPRREVSDAAPHARRWPRLAGVALGALVLAGALGACGTVRPLSTRVENWASATGLGDSDLQLVTDVHAVLSEEARGRVGQVKLDCVGLGNEARKAHGELVSPDSVLTLALDQAYRDFFTVATTCYARDGHLDTAERTELAAGLRALERAEARYAALERGETPPSTALPPASYYKDQGDF